jgi:hypothetical protein
MDERLKEALRPFAQLIAEEVVRLQHGGPAAPAPVTFDYEQLAQAVAHGVRMASRVGHGLEAKERPSPPPAPTPPVLSLRHPPAVAAAKDGRSNKGKRVPVQEAPEGMELVGIKEAARLSGLSHSTLNGRVQRGALKAYRPRVPTKNQSYVVSVDEVLAYAAARESDTKEAARPPSAER